VAFILPIHSFDDAASLPTQEKVNDHIYALPTAKRKAMRGNYDIILILLWSARGQSFQKTNLDSLCTDSRLISRILRILSSGM
jgi:hypothetical protein